MATILYYVLPEGDLLCRTKFYTALFHSDKEYLNGLVHRNDFLSLDGTSHLRTVCCAMGSFYKFKAIQLCSLFLVISTEVMDKRPSQWLDLRPTQDQVQFFPPEIMLSPAAVSSVAQHGLITPLVNVRGIMCTGPKRDWRQGEPVKVIVILGDYPPHQE